MHHEPPHQKLSFPLLVIRIPESDEAKEITVVPPFFEVRELVEENILNEDLRKAGKECVDG